MTDAEGRTTVYEYDLLSRRVAEVRPLGQRAEYRYDARGRLEAKVNARGQKIAYRYEAWGPVKAIDYYPDTSATTAGKTLAFGYDTAGRLAAVTDSTISGLGLYWSYDALNRVDREYLFGLGVGKYRYLDHDYDRYGNRSALALYRYEAGTGWTERYRYTYTYGKLGNLGQAGLIGGVFGFSHEGSGLRTALIRPTSVISTYGYDGVGRLSQIKVTGTAGTLAQYDYVYDAVGNVDALTTLAGTHDYSYDGLNRLVQALHPAASGLPQEDFAYDLVGNREDPTDETLYDYDANDRIVKSPDTVYAFDDDGNLVMRQAGALAELFRYDEENRLVEYFKGATHATYAYDAFGRRIRKTVSDGSTTTTVWYLWDGARLLGEYDDAGNRIRRYAYLPDTFAPVQMEDATGVYDVHADHLDTPKFLTDAGQRIVWKAEHLAYGATVPDEDPDGDGTKVAFHFRFPGQYYDQETGLHYNYFRYYDPNTGRYITEDPIGLIGGINLYRYAYSNPIALSDVLGLDVDKRGFDAVFPPTTNCAIVAECKNRLDRYYLPKTGTVDMPREDSRGKESEIKKFLNKLGKDLVLDITKEYAKGAICSYFNSEKCNTGDPDLPIWPPVPDGNDGNGGENGKKCN